MPVSHARILPVESDPQISTLICRQSWGPPGHFINNPLDPNQVTHQVGKFTPDLMVIEHNFTCESQLKPDIGPSSNDLILNRWKIING